MRKRKNLKSINPVQREIESLKQKAWKLVSEYVRLRDGRCVTCGGEAQHGGHYWHNRLDFNEININGQCAGCNLFKSGNLASYSLYLESKYGNGILQYLDKLKSIEQKNTSKGGRYLSWKLTPEVLQRIIGYYQSKIKSIRGI